MGVSEEAKDRQVNRRRFNDAQIELLENMFEAQARPELRVKQQLAKNLGLQSRQVAIWFQNKRARSKSKQIERDYMMLKMSYDHLDSEFQSLKKEHDSLLIQLQSLRKLTEEEGKALEAEEKPNFTLESYSPEFLLPLCDGGGGSCSSVEEKRVFEADGLCYSSDWWEF